MKKYTFTHDMGGNRVIRQIVNNRYTSTSEIVGTVLSKEEQKNLPIEAVFALNVLANTILEFVS